MNIYVYFFRNPIIKISCYSDYNLSIKSPNYRYCKIDFCQMQTTSSYIILRCTYIVYDCNVQTSSLLKHTCFYNLSIKKTTNYWKKWFIEHWTINQKKNVYKWTIVVLTLYFLFIFSLCFLPNIYICCF